MDEKNKEGATNSGGALKEMIDWIICIAVAVGIAFVIKTYVMTVAQVEGDSMLNTLHDSERLITWKLGYTPKNNDVIIFQPRSSTPGNEKYYVKRVIAVEGQTVEIDYDTNSVYVDGERLDEEYINEEFDDFGNLRDQMEPKSEGNIWTVGEDEVFVMGDNRNHSLDSRSSEVGMVNLDSVEGKVVLRFWPLNKFGFVK